MVYLIAAFLSAISVAQPSGKDPCLNHDLNYHSPPDAFEYGAIITGSVLGGILGYGLGQPSAYSYTQVRQWFQLDQILMDKSYSSIRQLQNAAEKLQETYADYYRMYERETLRPLIAERILPAQNTFIDSVKQLFQVLAPEQPTPEQIPKGRSELASLVTNHRNHITRSILKDLRLAFAKIHDPHMQKSSYSEIADKYVAPLNQTFTEFIGKIDAIIPCEEALTSTTEKFSEQQRQFLITVLGGTAGGFAGWISSELVKAEAMKFAGSVLLPALCARLDNLPQQKPPETPPAPPKQEALETVVKPPEPPARRTHEELDR